MENMKKIVKIEEEVFEYKRNDYTLDESLYAIEISKNGVPFSTEYYSNKRKEFILFADGGNQVYEYNEDGTCKTIKTRNANKELTCMSVRGYVNGKLTGISDIYTDKNVVYKLKKNGTATITTGYKNADLDIEVLTVIPSEKSYKTYNESDNLVSHTINLDEMDIATEYNDDFIIHKITIYTDLTKTYPARIITTTYEA